MENRFYGVEAWTRPKLNHKCLENLEEEGCRKISLADRMKTYYKESRRILICYKQQQEGSLTGTNFLRKHVIEGKIVGKIKVTGRRKPQMDNSEEKTG
jgi:hypothetical protein